MAEPRPPGSRIQLDDIGDQTLMSDDPPDARGLPRPKASA